ncbi:MAG TPA: hypothetical protein VL793_13100 [Patescibacteria group bacterium]|nr:hypothetical protein [Patescibacteria group bacterium]
MNALKCLLLTVLLNSVCFTHAYGMAGDLKSPSLAMPSETPVSFRTNVIAAISEKDCKFIDGHFINAITTLHYGGSGAALSRLIARLGQIEGVRVQMTFVHEADGTAWTIQHNGWGEAGEIHIQVNLDARGMKLDDLQITVTGQTPLQG